MPEDVAEERRPIVRNVAEEVERRVGIVATSRRRALVAVELDEQVPGDAEREEVDRRAAHDLVCAQT